MKKYIVMLSVFLLLGALVFAQDVRINISRAKMTEVYTTVNSIESSEEAFYLEKGYYASKHNDPQKPFYNLCNTNEDSCRQLFSQILSVDIPQTSPFAYEVTDSPARISVYVKAAMDKGILCYKIIEGGHKGQWFINNKHPCKDSLLIEGAQFYE